MYNPKSHKAEEFINHEEVLASINYAEENKNNLELIDKILKKAKLGKGLEHREAAVLLACEIEEKNKEILRLPKKLKKIITATESCFCISISIKLLCEWLRLLPLSCQKQAYSA